MKKPVLLGFAVVMFGVVIWGLFMQGNISPNDAQLVSSTQTTDEAEPVSELKPESEGAVTWTGPELSQKTALPQANEQQGETEYVGESQSEVGLKIQIDTYAEYEDEYASLSQNADYPTMGYRMSEMNARRPNADFTPEDVLQALAEPAAWQPLVSPPDELLAQAKDESWKFVQFNRMKIETLVAGDSLEIPIENTGSTYVMNVKQVEANVDGNITWRGTIDYGAGQYPVSLTQNDSNVTVGGFSTPEGHFMLQATNGMGWIVASSGVDRDNSGTPDYIIPDVK